MRTGMFLQQPAKHCTQKRLGRYRDSLFIDQATALAVAVDPDPEVRLRFPYAVGQGLQLAAGIGGSRGRRLARKHNDLAGDVPRKGRQISSQRAAGGIDHKPQRSQGMKILVKASQVGDVCPEPGRATVAAGRAIDAVLQQRFQFIQASTGRQRPSALTPESHRHLLGSGEIAADQQPAVGRQVIDGKSQAGRRGATQIDHLAPGLSQSLAGRGRQFGGHRSPVAGDHRGGQVGAGRRPAAEQDSQGTGQLPNVRNVEVLLIDSVDAFRVEPRRRRCLLGGLLQASNPRRGKWRGLVTPRTMLAGGVVAFQPAQVDRAAHGLLLAGTDLRDVAG